MNMFNPQETKSIQALVDVIVESLAQGCWQDIVKSNPQLSARKINSLGDLKDVVGALSVSYLERRQLTAHGTVGSESHGKVEHLLKAVAKIKIEEDKIII